MTKHLEIAQRFRERATERENFNAFIRKEKADPGGSWYDTYSDADLLKHDLEVADLRFAAEVLEANALTTDEPSSK